ncbi:unnamed protein product [Prunus armeniaca]
MTTSTNLVETTLPGQVIGSHSPSHPNLGLRSSPPTRMSWCTRHLSYPSLPPGDKVFNTKQGRLLKTQKLGWAPITFCEEERGVILPHDDPIIIRADISNFDIGHILVDTSSSVSVMFADAFNELQIPPHLLDRSITPLVSFSGDVVQPIGSIHLPVSIGAAPQGGRSPLPSSLLTAQQPTTSSLGALPWPK